MSNEIYDLYVSKISRFNSDHKIIQAEFAKFLNETIEKNNLFQKFGHVKHVYIPYMSPESTYNELKTCIGFVRLSKHENHAEAAEFFWGKSFKGTPINVLKRQRPTGEVSLKNAYVVADYEAVESNEIAAVISDPIATQTADIAAQDSTEIMSLKDERELRRLAESNAENLAQKMTKMVMFHEINEIKIIELTRENNQILKQNELMKSKVVELDNKVDLMGDEIKLLKEENEKLRKQATEHIELANQISKLLKKF